MCLCGISDTRAKVSIGTLYVTLSCENNLCPNRPNRPTLWGWIARLKHEDGWHVSSPSTARKGLAAAVPATMYVT